MKTPARWLALIIGAYLALGLLYDWATPIFEATDEGYHVAAIRWMALGNGLPVQNPQQPGEWLQEGSQPPLYHLLSAALVRGIEMRDWQAVFVRNPFLHHAPGVPQNVNFYRHLPAETFPYHDTALAVHLIRWFSVALGALTIALTYRLTAQLFPQHCGLWILAAAVVAFNPKFIFVSASVNNDNLLMTLSTASLVMALPLLRPEVKNYFWKITGLGLLLGLAALTKISGLVLWPVAALCVAWGARRDWKRALAGGALMGVIALAVCGWWYWRNVQLYGELLGLNTMVAVAHPRATPLGVLQLIREEGYGFYRSYWGVFGVFTILEAPWVRWLFDGLTAWALVGLAWRARRQRTWPRVELMVLAVFCLLTLAGVIRWSLLTPASQGRLMFGAIAPLSLFFALGLRAPFEARLRQPFGVWSLGLGIFLFALVAALIPLWHIAPRYAPPPRLTEANLPSDLRPVRAIFNETIELLGYVADTAPRHPGEHQRVTLYWRALQPMSADYALALHLLGRAGAEVGKLDTWPGGGTAPTTQWKPGDIFADAYQITIDPQAIAPTALSLYLAFWDGQPENLLPATTIDGTPISVTLAEVGRVTPPAAPRFAPAIADGSTFEYGIKLLGIDVGEGGAFTLYWQTAQAVPANFTVFAHLLDVGGLSVAQADSQPLNGDWPTSAWVPGLPFAETRRFDVSGLPPGRYSIQLGWYDGGSLARLSAYQSNGAPWPEDGVLFENVIEVK